MIPNASFICLLPFNWITPNLTIFCAKLCCNPVIHAIMSATRIRRFGAVLAAAAGGTSILLFTRPSMAGNDRGPSLDLVRSQINDSKAVVPSRVVQESSLIAANNSNPLDILVIGGGATGCGVALDAATRGLRVGLVEREDFSSGTSSRSTKLIHGGEWLNFECWLCINLLRLTNGFVWLCFFFFKSVG